MTILKGMTEKQCLIFCKEWDETVKAVSKNAAKAGKDLRKIKIAKKLTYSEKNKNRKE